MTAATADRIAITEPGVYDDIPHEAYHADPVAEGSLSSTGAKLLLPPSCPAKFAYWQEHGEKPKAQFDLGQAVHTLVLGVGPSLVRIEADDWRTKAAKTLRTEAHEAGKTPLLAEDYDLAVTIAGTVLRHHIAGPLLEPGTGQPEQTLIWRDPETLTMCRARLDFARRSAGRLVVVDLKTTYSAEQGSLSRSMVTFGYNLSAAHYLDGVTELDLADDPLFVFVAVEKDPPHLITIAEPDADAIAAGRLRARKARRIYRDCRTADHWPGYCDDVISLPMPPWAARQHDNAVYAGEYDFEDMP